MLWIILAWALGGAIGWTIGEELTEAVGAGIGAALGAGIGMAITLRNGHVRSDQKSILLITFAWAIGTAIGWTIAKPLLIEERSLDFARGWTIGRAIAGAIGGFVMSWQMGEWKNKQ